MIRHARAEAAAVSVTCDGETVVVEVVDDGTGDTARRPGRAGRPGGYGLVGMAERAAVLGGRLDHGTAPGGGFRVRAVLPTGRGGSVDGVPAVGGGGQR